MSDLENDRAVVAELMEQFRTMRMPSASTQEGRDAIERIAGALCDIRIEMKPFTHPKRKVVGNA